MEGSRYLPRDCVMVSIKPSYHRISGPVSHYLRNQSTLREVYHSGRPIFRDKAVQCS